MDLSKLTAQELKDLCKQYQKELEAIKSKTFWQKLKDLLTNR
mgnify:CR=1 FL=1